MGWERQGLYTGIPGLVTEHRQPVDGIQKVLGLASVGFSLTLVQPCGQVVLGGL